MKPFYFIYLGWLQLYQLPVLPYMRHLFLTVLLIASISFNIIGLMIVSNLLKEFLSPYLLICLGLVLLFVTLILYLKKWSKILEIIRLSQREIKVNEYNQFYNTLIINERFS